MKEEYDNNERRKQHEPIRVTQRNYSKLPEGTYRIDKGLYLRRRDGRGSYFMRILVDGRRRDVAIGSAADMPPEIAKGKAARIRCDIEDGKWDWGDGKKDSYLLKDFWEEAITTCSTVRQWKDSRKRLQTIKYQMEHYVLPIIGEVDVRTMTREDILKVIGETWNEKATFWNRIRIALSMILGVAVSRGLRIDNPAGFKGSLEYFLPPVYKVQKVEHRRAPTFDQAKEIVELCRSSPFVLKRLILFVALTALRVSEAGSIKWSDVDLDRGIAIVKDEEMKVSRGFDRRIPLCSQLVDIMRMWEHRGEFVFSSDGKHRASKSSATVALKMIVPNITMHGFRSTFCDWCTENGVLLEVSERCLDHAVGSKVRQAYQRSDLLDLRREALQRYADALMG